MNHSYPIYTAEAECQDCFKCVRHCPVKAIKVENGHASVIPELCIACGHCVEICPAHAKKVRQDIGRSRQLLTQRKIPVYASLAPSWISEFKGLPKENLIAALHKLGFAGVSETALGAQVVSSQLAESLRGIHSGVMISSACPVAVDMIRKYIPEFTSTITPVLSPALTHARMLREKFGADIAVVFIGPCIAKKNEADRHPNLINTAILFPRLIEWFKEEGIDPWQIEPQADDKFVLEDAEEGALYPIEGGMNKTIFAHGGCEHINYTCISGVQALSQALNGLRPQDVKEPVFIETLACIGGCVHGPGTSHISPGLLERLRVIGNTTMRSELPKRGELDIMETYNASAVNDTTFSLQEMKKALRRVGKTSSEDELNCGGCGYDTCNNFARALIEGKAEPNMCVSYLRKLAQKKSNAILRCVPAAVVIVERGLKLIECNQRFAELLGEDIKMMYEVKPGMAGADLRRLIPFADLFEQVLSSGNEIKRDMLRLGKQLLSVNIFNIDSKQVVGAMLFDVTSTEFRREQIAGQAREVINKNLATVQDIACRLGEHMAETEILLRSIADDYAGHRNGGNADHGK
ncbi:MAG: [Fe-Fe] hydrogenase large subunit C-terminal domain-containing protein [Victivallaceae bacterium]|jgi:iron only hydrogenase large subunit-like protein|nr:[Fe-Fe] hydrogenase large subunit C-terminal domain-containing protein [Victivallaceae bacterium]MDD3115928.1 [Fe-Fe] hydrogenase large subunit C-terminal domain-containing protein [Victivallaceae bacterium]MDD3703510.1 [Fe-Fe] hydrogenase large subunit C-terminal domain-containing protein [Victivallaceae bacterium]MDD4317125.1 [Fe-Fe] hydrogenase large subunit C-terminal domain-containing protein [Victivallaceae bacterium]